MTFNDIFTIWTSIIDPDLIKFFFYLFFIIVFVFVFIDRFSK